MTELLCGYDDTTTGRPCENPISDKNSVCAAGHLIPNWMARVFDGSFRNEEVSIEFHNFDEEELGLVTTLEDNGPLYHLAEFTDDGLALSDEAIELVRRKSLSPSTANAMFDCGSRWAIERLLPRSEDPFGPAELGSSAHRAFEKLYDLEPEARTDEALKNIIRDLHDDKESSLAVPEEEQLNKWRWSIYEVAGKIREIEEPSEVDVVGNEIQADAEVAGVPFGGFVDRLAYVDGKLTVSDFKTGKLPNPRFPNVGYDEQLRLYVLALREMGHEPEAAELLYTKFGKRHKVDLSESLLSGTKERFKKAWSILQEQTESKKFNYKPGALCSWCPAFDSCPGAGGKARHKNAPVPEVSTRQLGLVHASEKV